MKRAQHKSNISIIKDYLNDERPFVQVGYNGPAEVKRKDGDTWIDRDGTEWIQVGYTRMTKKMKEIRENTKQVCASCNRDIFWSGDKNDEIMFKKTGKCYDCVIEEETKMRLDGTYENYEKTKIIKNQQSFLKELEDKIKESIQYLENKSNKLEFINEDGSTELWSDTQREKLLEDAKKDLEEVKKSLILCGVSLTMLADERTKHESTKNT